jgi:hypothetical protein
MASKIFRSRAAPALDGTYTTETLAHGPSYSCRFDPDPAGGLRTFTGALFVVAVLAACGRTPRISAHHGAEADDAGAAVDGGACSFWGFIKGLPGPFDYFPSCTTDIDCGPGRACYTITREHSICDAAVQSVRDSCTTSADVDLDLPDECGCGGLTCGAGSRCISVEKYCSCRPAYHNACGEAACADPGECAAGTVCTPPTFIGPAIPQQPRAGLRCTPAECSSDADCTQGPCGRCRLHVSKWPQSGPWRIDRIACSYGPDATFSP